MDPDQHCLIDSNGTKFSAVFDNSSRLFPDARKALQDKNRRHVISDFDSLRIRSVVAELNGGTCSQSLEIGQTNRDKVLMVSALFKDRTNIKYDSKVQMFETLYVDGTVTQYSLDCFLNKTGIFEYVDTDFFILQKLAHADDASDFNYWRKMRRLSECSGQLLAYLRWVSLPEKERKEQSDKDQQLQRSCKAAALQAQRYLLIEQLKLGSITHAEARHLSEQFQQQLSGKRVPQNNRATTTAEQLSLRAFQSRLYQDKSHQKNSTIQKSHRGGVDSCESYVHSLSTITGNTIPTTAIRKDSSDTRDSHSRSGSLNDSHVVNLLSEYDSEHANQVHSRRSISYEHERFNQLTVVREALARSSKVMHDNLNYL